LAQAKATTGRAGATMDELTTGTEEGTSALRYRNPVDARGFVILSGAVLVDRELSDGAKVTYLLLLDYARQDNTCWPGQATLAAERGLKERAIRNHLTELEGRGLISVEQRGLRKTNIYWLENVQEVYGQNKQGRTFDRQKKAGQERQKNAGQERQNFAYKEDTDRNIHKGSRTALNVPKTENEKPAKNPTLNTKGTGIYAIRDQAVEEIVTLTKDENSKKRFEQLWEVAETQNALTAWQAALQALKRRAGAKEKQGLDRPGAYFCKICVQELEKRGVFVPTNAEKKADGDVAEIIRQGLFGEEANDMVANEVSEASTNEFGHNKVEPRSQKLGSEVQKFDSGGSDTGHRSPVLTLKEGTGKHKSGDATAEIRELQRRGGAEYEAFLAFIATERKHYEQEMVGMGNGAKQRLLTAFDQPAKQATLYKKWRNSTG
jgi:hypothetical protein